MATLFMLLLINSVYVFKIPCWGNFSAHSTLFMLRCHSKAHIVLRPGEMGKASYHPQSEGEDQKES